jgi:hypothetical protein
MPFQSIQCNLSIIDFCYLTCMVCVHFFSHTEYGKRTPHHFLFTIMAASSRKRKRRGNDSSHTFLIPPLDSPHFSSAGSLAVVEKVSSDYRRTLPQTHNIRLPTPPPQLFSFDDFKLDEDEGSYDTVESKQPVIFEVTKDSAVERRKLYTSSVS